MTCPADVVDRRAGQDPWVPPAEGTRPRRISDDLAWLRLAMDEPEENGLRQLADDSRGGGANDIAAVGIWEVDAAEVCARFTRLSERGVLDAAGFLVHEQEIDAA